MVSAFIAVDSTYLLLVPLVLSSGSTSIYSYHAIHYLKYTTHWVLIDPQSYAKTTTTNFGTFLSL